MPGGLIQIVAYGAQDLYLTGIPEITYFKFIYKRYTNFAKEFIDLNFDGDKNFGQEISCNIPKDGDLINELILKVTLPSVKLEKSTSNSDIVTQNLESMNSKEILYKNFKNFIKYIYESIKLAKNGINNINQNFDSIYNLIDEKLDSNSDFLFKKNQIDKEISKQFDIVSHLLNIQILNINEFEKKQKLSNLIDSYIELSNSICKKLFNDYISAKNVYENSLNNNYNFSWIKELSWNIISEASFVIGSDIIDRQFGMWLHLWYELFETGFKKLDLGRLHSLSSISYNFNNLEKPQFEIYIPLKFYFCRNIGLSIPLVSLRYQSVSLTLKIEKLNKLIRTNYDKDDIESLVKIKDIKLLTNYIYLDQDEREKFAESKHEYLIEQTSLQNNLFKKSNEINVDLNFSNPLKYFIFNLQNSNFINTNKTFNSYGVQKLVNSSLENSGDTIKEANLDLNGVERLKFLDSKYFNLITPYENLRNSLPDGLYFYSFSINPKDIQPSGTCNFSRLERKRLNLKISDDFNNSLNVTEEINVNVLSVNYNILKFGNGLCNLTFNF